MEGAQLVAITHGHSLGYMPAAVLVHILHRIIYRQEVARGGLNSIELMRLYEEAMRYKLLKQEGIIKDS